MSYKNTMNLELILNQRKLYSHIAFLLISLLSVAFFVITDNKPFSFRDQLGIVILIVVYLEAFIFIAGKIFRNMGTDTASKEFLRKITVRFLIFYLACFVSALVIYLLFQGFHYWIDDLDITTLFYNFVHFEFKPWFGSTIKGLSFGAVIFLLVQWLDALKRERKLKEEQFQKRYVVNMEKVSFLKVAQEKTEVVSIVLFKEEDINLEKGDYVEVIGEIEEYEGKNEIIGNLVKRI